MALLSILIAVYAGGGDVELGYLSGKNKNFSEPPRILSTWSGWYNALHLNIAMLSLFCFLSFVYLIRPSAERPCPDSAVVFLLSASIGLTQYLIVIADGMYEFQKHCMMGNFAFSIALLSYVPYLVDQMFTVVSRNSRSKNTVANGPRSSWT